MSLLSKNIASQLHRMRQKAGTFVILVRTGKPYKAIIEMTSGVNAGTQFLHTDGTPFMAAYAPVLFRFSPQDFAPYTKDLAPHEQDTILWHQESYTLTRRLANDVDDDTIGISLYGYKNRSF